MLERFRAFWTGVWAPVGNLLIRWGVSFITVFVFSDMVDGYMARTSGQTSAFGAFLDSTLDRIGDAAIFGGLAMYYVGPGDSSWKVALSIYCLTMGAVTSYARARAESLGMQAKVGIAERSDRLVLILAAVGLADL